MSLKYDKAFNPNGRKKHGKKKFLKLLHSFLGLFYGIVVTYGLYYLFTTQFNVNPAISKWIFSIFGVPLSIGCSYSSDFRCTIFLFLPHFFSKRGRTALIAYAFALSLTGPTKNIVKNMEVLGHSLNCAEDKLKEALNAILVIAKSPIIAIKEAITNVLHQIRKVMRKVRDSVIKMVNVSYAISKCFPSFFR